MDTIRRRVAQLEQQLVDWRRDFHQYAESGWVEYRTASLIARELDDLGYELLVGREALEPSSRMGLPDKDSLERHWHRALEQGGVQEYMARMRGGYTAVVATISNGRGPVTALRFDIDALDIQEDQTDDHRPYREGFASVNPNMMHACGHDSHAAIGLGVARVLARSKGQVRGTVRLVFQPAEEGVRGAKAIVDKGILDDVDYMLGQHVMTGWGVGEMASGMGGYAATEKFDVTFSGRAAHAGGRPDHGKNALLAAATAVTNLYAISRHSTGATRINVGKLTAGTGRNVIPDEAFLVMETRGATSELSDYMYDKAQQVLRGAADMYDCELTVKRMGGAQSADSDLSLAERVEDVARRMGGLTFYPLVSTGGSEDYTYMMRRVQERGGLATNIGIGADLHGASREPSSPDRASLGAHTPTYDMDERAMPLAVALLSRLVLDLGRNPVRKRS